MILLAVLVTRSSVMSLRAKEGLPWGNQVVGWIVLGEKQISGLDLARKDTNTLFDSILVASSIRSSAVSKQLLFAPACDDLCDLRPDICDIDDII